MKNKHLQSPGKNSFCNIWQTGLCFHLHLLHICSQNSLLSDASTDRLHPEEVIARVPQPPLLHHAPCFCHISSGDLLTVNRCNFCTQNNKGRLHGKSHFKIRQQQPKGNRVLAGFRCLRVGRPSIVKLTQTHLKKRSYY